MKACAIQFGKLAGVTPYTRSDGHGAVPTFDDWECHDMILTGPGLAAIKNVTLHSHALTEVRRIDDTKEVNPVAAKKLYKHAHILRVLEAQ